MKEIFNNKWTYLIIGIVLGGFVQYISSVIANENLKKDLIAELTLILEKKKTARTNAEDEKRIIEIQAQLNLLNKNKTTIKQQQS